MTKAEEEARNYMKTLEAHRVMGITQDTRGRYYTRYYDQPFCTTGPGMSLEQAVKKCHLEKADYIQFNSCCNDALMPIDEALNMLERMSSVESENLIQQFDDLLEDVEDSLSELLDIVLTQCDQDIYPRATEEAKIALGKIDNYKRRLKMKPEWTRIALDRVNDAQV